jgi:transmembrane sensor
MLQHENYYKDLLLGFIRNSISEEQVKELYQFIDQQPEEYSLLMDEPDVLFQISQQMQEHAPEIPDEVHDRMEERLRVAIEEDAKSVGKKPLVRKLMNWKWAAAAVFLIVAGVALIINIPNKNNALTTNGNQVAVDVKAPGLNKAMVTLSDGRTVLLSSLSKGLLAQQGNVELVKLADGRVAYRTKDGKQVNELQYNTLTNPVGSKVINMMLADGTHVWLNAGSSLTYPVAFTGKERRVQISGEAYFEVAHNASKPFYVVKNDLEVRVLGTHFNVNAYDDEKDIKVTLLEGSVKVATKRKTTAVILKPGQQAVNRTNTDDVSVISNAKTAQAIAWKDDKFQFQQTNIQEIMRQVARWYDVIIEYRGNMAAINFDGTLSRQASIGELLKRFEATGFVRFEIEGNNVIVIAK